MNPYLARTIIRHWPFRGKTRLLPSLLGLNVSTLPEGDIVEANDGRRFRIHRDGMYWKLFKDGSYNLDETEMLRLVAHPGDIIADVGANFGWYTTLFARIVGPKGHVHAFEPSPRIFCELQENVELNELSSVVSLNQFALGKQQGYSTLYTFSGLPHGHSSLCDLDRNDAASCEVEVRTLDDYLRYTGVPRLHLVKCDVEGSEMAVLEGAKEVIGSENPPLWAIEMNDKTSAKFGCAPPDFLKFLSEVGGYDTFLAYRSRSFVSLESFDAYKPGETLLCGRSKSHPGERLAKFIT